MLMNATPAKNTISPQMFAFVSLPTRARMYPAARLPSPHRTLTKGEDNPLPGGFANGLGKASPETP